MSAERAVAMMDSDDLDAGLGVLAEGETSLRSWLRQLHEADQLRQVQCEVDPDLELGAITRVNLGLAGPALLFENIKGYQGHPLDPFRDLRNGQ